MVSLEAHLKKARARRWAGKTAAEKKATASHAASSFWSRLTLEERSAIMRERARKRRKSKKD